MNAQDKMIDLVQLVENFFANIAAVTQTKEQEDEELEH